MLPAINAWMFADKLRIHVVKPDGSTTIETKPAAYVSYHQGEKLTPEVKRYLRTSKYVRGMSIEGPWVRVEWDSYESRKIHNLEIMPDGSPNTFFGKNSFEADVSPVKRYLIDNNIQIGEPKRVFLDIETDSRKTFVEACQGLARVLCWCLVDEQGNVHKEILNEDTDEDERRVLGALWEAMSDFDQVIAWNGDGFDFPVIQERSRYLQIQHRAPNTFLWLDHKELFVRVNNAENADEKASFKLQDVTMAMLGEGKDDLDGARTWHYWVEGGAQRQKLYDYNVKDTMLLLKLEQKTGFIKLLQALAMVSGVFPDSKGLQPLTQVDSFMLRLGKARGIHFKTNFRNPTRAKVRGAYVMQPEVEGIEKLVHVADFRRLYPSIILSWNMSPETLVEGREPEPTGHYAKCPTIASVFDVSSPGILPSALKDLIRLRQEWNDKKASLPPGTPEWFDADRLSNAYKVAANSFYGVIASPFSRYFHPLIAESVTQTGVYLIHATKAMAEKMGMKVIYADTDSIFVKGVGVSEFKQFVGACNEHLYPRIASKFGCIENDIYLAYEKAFERIVFVSAKKYAGKYLHYKGKQAVEGSKPEVKGLEFKRGDAVKLARSIQEQLINMVLRGDEDLEAYEKFLQQRQTHVLTDPLEVKDIVQVKALSRDVALYRTKQKKDGTQTLPPRHVQVAGKLKERGEEIREGTKIQMIVMDSTATPPLVIPAQDYTGECDRHYLWENLVYPPLQRLLEGAFPKHDWKVFSKTRPVLANPRRKVRDTTNQLELVPVVAPTMPKVRPRATKATQPTIQEVIQTPQPKLEPVGVDIVLSPELSTPSSVTRLISSPSLMARGPNALRVSYTFGVRVYWVADKGEALRTIQRFANLGVSHEAK